MNCPGKERLHGYLLGTLDPGSNDAIDEHLEHCTACLSAAETLDAAATPIFSSLRSATVRSPELEGSAFRDLVEKVKSLGAQPISANRPLAAGTVLGNYVVGEPIAAGGMGRVHKAEHRLMKRVVALKVLPPELFRAPHARTRFRREVEAAAKLTSPHIVAAFDAGECDGRDYLVMEYVEGRTLADRVKADGPLGVRQALDCILQAARGLEHAHAAGIVHRDIKPANLIMTEAAEVKILDMGLARIQEASDESPRSLTSANVVMGTASYMAPEQAVDTRTADGRADIYSLGCTLFFLLTGKSPYEASTSIGTLLAHREQPIPSLRTARPDCPAAVDGLFRRLVAKDPAERPANVAAVRIELERLLASLGDTKPERNAPRWRVVGASSLRRGSPRPSCWRSLRCTASRRRRDPKKSWTRSRLQWSPSRRRPTKIAAAPIPKERAPIAPLIDMKFVKPGEFLIGATLADLNAGPDEKPQRPIKITQGFFLGKTKVTQAQYRLVTGANPSIFSSDRRFKGAVEAKDTSDYPVDSVSWLDAIRFCNQLSEREGLPPYYQRKEADVTLRGGSGYRLPTEAEWEFASRAGTTTIWSFGDDPAHFKPEYAWFAANSDEDHAPGRPEEAQRVRAVRHVRQCPRMVLGPLRSDLLPAHAAHRSAGLRHGSAARLPRRRLERRRRSNPELGTRCSRHGVHGGVHRRRHARGTQRRAVTSSEKLECAGRPSVLVSVDQTGRFTRTCFRRAQAMRFHRGRMLLGCAAFVAVAAAAYCCGSYGEGSQAPLASGVKLPGPIARSVIRDNVLVALLADGRLISVHLDPRGATKILGNVRPADSGARHVPEQGVRRVEESRDDRRPDGRENHSGGRRAIIRSMPSAFLGPERVYLQSGPQIRVLDVTNTAKRSMTSAARQVRSESARTAAIARWDD